MGSSKDERETRADFAERYQARASLEILGEVEREVIGEAFTGAGPPQVSEFRMF